MIQLLMVNGSRLRAQGQEKAPHPLSSAAARGQGPLLAWSHEPVLRTINNRVINKLIDRFFMN